MDLGQELSRPVPADLKLPRDVREALKGGNINLFESHQLARLTVRKWGGTDAEARLLW